MRQEENDKSYAAFSRFGEWLVARGDLSESGLHKALQMQERVSLNLALLSWTRLQDHPALLNAVIASTSERSVNFLEALQLLGVVGEEDLLEVRRAARPFRIPLGIVLTRLGLTARGRLAERLEEFRKLPAGSRSLAKLLDRTTLLAGVPESLLLGLAENAHPKKRLAGEVVYERGGQASCFLVQSGLVRFLLGKRLEPRTVGVAQPGEFLGLAAAVSSAVHSEDAVAVTDSLVWQLDVERVMSVLNHRPEAMLRAAQFLSTRIQRLHNILEPSHSAGAQAASRPISVLLYDGDAPPEKFLAHLLQRLAEIHSDYPDKRRAAIALMGKDSSRFHEPGGKEPISFLEPGENPVQRISTWLHNRAGSELRIVLAPGNHEDLRRFLLGACTRSATIGIDSRPTYLPHLKPGRDRFYLVAERAPDRAYSLHAGLCRIFPRLLLPNVVSPDEYPTIAPRIARWLSHRSLGLAFGGGGARALAQVGALNVLGPLQLPIDMVSGTSAGAHVGGMIACGYSHEQISDFFMRELVQQRNHAFNDITLPRRSLIRGRKYGRILERAFGERTTAETKIPFFPVATDLQSGTETIPRNLPLAVAVLASGSAPGIFPPVAYGDTHLVDGGVVNNIPASVLKEWQTDFVISLNISNEPSLTRLNPNRIGSILGHSLEIFVNNTLGRRLGNVDLEIKPRVGGFKTTDHLRGRELIEAGEDAALRALPRLLHRLEHAEIIKGNRVSAKKD